MIEGMTTSISMITEGTIAKALLKAWLYRNRVVTLTAVSDTASP